MDCSGKDVQALTQWCCQHDWHPSWSPSTVKSSHANALYTFKSVFTVIVTGNRELSQMQFAVHQNV